MGHTRNFFPLYMHFWVFQILYAYVFACLFFFGSGQSKKLIFSKLDFFTKSKEKMEQFFYTIVNDIYNSDNDMNQVEFAEKFWVIDVDLATENITISKTIVQHPYMRNEWAYDVLSEHIQNEFLLKCCLAEFDSDFCDKLAEHIADKLIWTNTDFILERARLEASSNAQ